jgi:hypothetical protein
MIMTYPQPQPQPVGMVTAKNPAIGAALNAFWPGTGIVYAGQTLIGILAMFFGTAVLWWLFIKGILAVGSEDGGVVTGSLLVLSAPALWIANIVWAAFAVRGFNRRNGINVR